MANTVGDFFHYRWRTLLAGAVGLIAGVVADHLGAKSSVAALIGWNVAAVLFLVPTGKILFFDDAAQVRERAGREDENRAITMSLILAAVVTSLGGIVLALAASKTHGPQGSSHPAGVLALSASTLILNWLVVQSLFTLHYAHRYFGDRDDDGTADKGLQFNGDPPSTYRDFIYVAVCLGATFQVSDFNVTNTRFRNLITAHALISFVFNTMVLALGVNILGNLLGQ